MIRLEQNDYSKILKENGLKQTKQRSAILDYLEKCGQPVSAEQVYFEIKEQTTHVNISTVYRFLELLSDKNLVNKINIVGDSRTLFEINHKIHRHYLICLSCKKILPINSCPIEEYERSLENRTNYKIMAHKLIIYGYCPDCQRVNRK